LTSTKKPWELLEDVSILKSTQNLWELLELCDSRDCGVSGRPLSLPS
jgi:hypothetical protein